MFTLLNVAVCLTLHFSAYTQPSHTAPGEPGFNSPRQAHSNIFNTLNFHTAVWKSVSLILFFLLASIHQSTIL